ncbi:MAG: glutamate 5-kinase [Propionibacteriaceae bacterium]|nr:glutamate 5-kinase [Propionibacteriaceae bacterium]
MNIDAAADARRRVADAARVVVKVGSSSLTDPRSGVDEGRVARLVDTLAARRGAGAGVVLVSSGAIAAGMGPLGLASRPRDLARQQAAAAVGQGLLMARYTDLFARHGITAAQVLLTVDDLTRKASYANAVRTLTTLLRLGAVPVVNENDTVATQEIRFGDNDRLAALVAEVVRAEALVLLSDVDALYTAHPAEAGAERIDAVGDVDEVTVDVSRAGSSVGTGGMATKLEAARIATSAGIPVVLGRADDAAAALAGDDVGTVFSPVAAPRPRRLLWLAHATVVRGRLTIDVGAVAALRERGASLLAAGITAVTGDFVAGDPVEIAGPDGAVIARGLTNFSSEELPAMMGRRTAWLAQSLGSQFEREVVHRDAMVLLKRRRRPSLE